MKYDVGCFSPINLHTMYINTKKKDNLQCQALRVVVANPLIIFVNIWNFLLVIPHSHPALFELLAYLIVRHKASLARKLQ